MNLKITTLLFLFTLAHSSSVNAQALLQAGVRGMIVTTSMLTHYINPKNYECSQGFAKSSTVDGTIRRPLREFLP